MGSNYLKRQQELIHKTANIGVDIGYQKCWDLIQLALRDPDIVGKDTFGRERIGKLLVGLHKYEQMYRKAWTDDVESDYLQEQLDNALREIHGDALIPFHGRHPNVIRQAYTHGKKSWR